jgi:WD40 repeat protein
VYLAFSTKASLLAYSSISGPPTNRLAKVQLWDATKESIKAEIALGARCIGLVFAADGETLVTATAEPDARIALWTVPEGAPLRSFKKNVGGVDEAIPLAVTPDLRLGAYGSADGNVHVIDLSTGGEQWSSPAADKHLISLAFSPDGGTLATGAGYRESAIRLWDVANGTQTRRLKGHHRGIGALLFSPDGKRLFSASTDLTIRVWDLTDTSQTPRGRELRGHDEAVMRLALLPDNQTLVSASEDGVVYVWKSRSDEQSRTDIIVHEGIVAAGFTPDSSVVALNAQGEVKRWRAPDFAHAESEFAVEGEFDSENAIIAPDCHWLAIRRNDDTVEVWDLHRGAVHQRLPTRSELSWRFFPDGTKLVTLEKGTDLMHVWDLASGARSETWRRAIFTDRDYQIGNISPDNRWCLTIGPDGSGVFRDIVRRLDVDARLDARQPYNVVFSADSKFFAVTSGGGSKYTKVWDTAGKREVARLGGGSSVAFSPDGRRLAIAGGEEKAVGVWDLESRRQLVALASDGSGGRGAGFSPDGNVIGAVNSRGDMYLWRAPTFQEIAAAEARRQRKIEAQ